MGPRILNPFKIGTFWSSDLEWFSFGMVRSSKLTKSKWSRPIEKRTSAWDSKWPPLCSDLEHFGFRMPFKNWTIHHLNGIQPFKIWTLSVLLYFQMLPDPQFGARESWREVIYANDITLCNRHYYKIRRSDLDSKMYNVKSAFNTNLIVSIGTHTGGIWLTVT